MIEMVRHGCGRTIPVPCTERDEVYLNPAWCPHCGVKFFPRRPGPATKEEKEKYRAKRERFDEALKNVGHKIREKDEPKT
jgi:hypothetical protein